MTDDIVTSFRPVAETAKDVHDVQKRLTDPAYDDDQGAPKTTEVDALTVAQDIFSQGDQSIENDFDLSAMWVYWGQFLDHDVVLTPEQHGAEAELLKHAGPLSVARSDFVLDENGVRQYENHITPTVDASNVYGSSLDAENELRSFEGGRLATQGAGVDGVELLPTAAQLGREDGGDDFVAGDGRAAENPVLASLHTTFVNEHNYWADRLSAENPDWSDEQVFQNAKAIVETIVQKITYEEFLPVLVGDEMSPYEGYQPDVDPQVSTEFSTAAFRFGHTSIPNELRFLDEAGGDAQFAATVVDQFTRQESDVQVDGSMRLLDAFFNQTPLENGGVANALRGALEQKSEAIDTKVVDALNFFLFSEDGGETGFSLPERNILRGRDHGLESYINVRADMVGDIDPADYAGSTDFSIITSNPTLQAELAEVYGTVDKVDLFVGGLAEDYVDGATVGATFQAILVDQFEQMRDGDPYYYENREFAPEIQQEIEATSLSDVLMRSGGVEHVQRDALIASDRQGGDASDNVLLGDEGRDLLIGFEGNDRLCGGDGDDDLFGGEDADDLFGGRGSDGLNGGAGEDLLIGGRGDDELQGGRGDDQLRGGSGDDYLDGGEGSDVLHGGRGADTFVLRLDQEGVDTIVDFRANDQLKLLSGDGEAEALEVLREGGVTFIANDGALVAAVLGNGADELTVDDVIIA